MDSGLDAAHRPGMTAWVGWLFGMTSHVSPRSRGADAPELCMLAPPKEGRGECRVLDAPAVSRAKVCSEHTSIVTVGSPDQPGIPARNGFNGFLRDLPGDRAFLSPSPAVCLRKLDASVEASGPHDFAVRLGAVRQRHLHVHRIPPRVRDDRVARKIKWHRAHFILHPRKPSD